MGHLFRQVKSKYLIFDLDGKHWVCRGIEEEYDLLFVKQKLKHRGSKVNIWGSVSYDGVGWLYWIERNLDANQYIQILEGLLLHSVDDWDLDPSNTVSQQDNDPKHTAQIAKAWLNNSPLELLDQPPYSPDINLVEHVWSILETQIHHQNPPPTNANTLWQALEEEWYKIPLSQTASYMTQFCTRLMHCMKLEVTIPTINCFKLCVSQISWLILFNYLIRQCLLIAAQPITCTADLSSVYK